MKEPVGLPKKAVTWALAALIGFSGVYVPDVARAQEEPAVPEWAVDDGNVEDGLHGEAALPTKYDLRSEGVVTPVKFQNPWGSCWAFGGTAAAETSILSAYGSTYESYNLDLSERHLTYFALQPVSEAADPAQAGEGLHTIDPSANAVFDAGGHPVYITTLFSQGIGPMLESLYPYRGNNAITTLDDFNEHSVVRTKEAIELSLRASRSTLTADEFIEVRAQQTGKTTDQVLAEFTATVKASIEDSPTYAKTDDWSIPETNADGSLNRLVSNGMVLRNGNVLPTYWTGDVAPSREGMDAIKQEVLNGHGVSIMYFGDQNGKYSTSPSETSHDQTQYVYEDERVDHGVCIVGWDDDYSAENFSHGATPEEQAITTPPGNGAWIVKNSWGSETDATTDDLGNTINKRKWGTLNDEGKSTGYFYLSYYDKTIKQAESMEFDADIATEGTFEVLQHDYMPSDNGFYTTPLTEGSNVTSSANVFEAKNGTIAVKSVSTRTSETNSRVTFAIYELKDGATNPTEGKMLYRSSRNFEYGGFHRLNLDQPIKIGAGKRFSVVSTISTVDAGGVRLYSATANHGASEEAINSLTRGQAKSYATAVINEGESYLYTDGSWQDWKDYTNALPLEEKEKEIAPSATKHVDAAPIDNFSIKAYAVPASEAEPGVLTLAGSGHVQSIGDKSATTSGEGILIGTTGEAKRLEQFSVSLPEGTDGSIEYRGHVKGIGWNEWAKDGAPCGTTGESRRIEAVQMTLSGAVADDYSVWYRVHSQTYGWLGWATDGQAAGTASQGKRAEAVEVQVLPKGQTPEGYVEGQASYVGAATGEAHVQGTGWVAPSTPLEFGTTGQSKRLEAIKLSVLNQPAAGGIFYEVHARGNGWMPAAADGAMAGTEGESRRIEAVRISLTGDMAGERGYSVWYRVRSQSHGWLGWAHDGADAGTTGLGKRAEAIEVQILPQGQVPNGYDASQAACVAG